jgi:hypothetical protein
MKPGDHVIWLRAPGRSILSGWKTQKIHGVVVRVCRHRIRIRTYFGGKEKIVSVDPDNTLACDDVDHADNTMDVVTEGEKDSCEPMLEPQHGSNQRH